MANDFRSMADDVKMDMYNEQIKYDKEQGLHEYTAEEVYNEFYVDLKNRINDAKTAYYSQRNAIKQDYKNTTKNLKDAPIPSSIRTMLIKAAKTMRDEKLANAQKQASRETYAEYKLFLDKEHGINITEFLSPEDFNALTKKDEFVCACKEIVEEVGNLINMAARSAKSIGKSVTIKPVSKVRDFVDEEIQTLGGLTKEAVSDVNYAISDCNRSLKNFTEKAKTGFCKMGLAIKNGFKSFIGLISTSVTKAATNIEEYADKKGKDFANFINNKRLKLYNAQLVSTRAKATKIENSIFALEQLDKALFDLKQSSRGVTSALSAINKKALPQAAAPAVYTESKWLISRKAYLLSKINKYDEKTKSLDAKIDAIMPMPNIESEHNII